MIIGVILRNFKVYKKIHFIPLSNGTNFNGLIGMNGVGKSSILEALDCFFNQKPWIVNLDNTKLDESWVMPILAFDNSIVEFGDLSDVAQKITDYVLSEQLPTDAVGNNYRDHIEGIRRYIPENLKRGHYIIPLCLNGSYMVDLGVFKYNSFKQAIFASESSEEEQDRIIRSLYELVRTKITYVYVPKDIEAERYVAFQNQDMQRLMGKELTTIVSEYLTKSDISNISKGLKGFVNELSQTLDGYHFKTPTSYQPNLRDYKIYNLIIDEFFSLRELFKVADGKDIPLRQLSSGEKQQAIIKLITRLVTKYRTSNRGLIVAVDEPESSLHVSLCYEQFEKLYEVSQSCSQVLFASHWYGFIPTLTQGSILNISSEGTYNFMLFNADNYREEIRFADRERNGQLPLDIMVKSSNDLVQSILSSVVREDCYNWLLCEGSSDKIYLNEYLKEEIQSKRLRIIPVCKASEIKKMYEHLSIAIDELKGNVKGKIYMLTDTDAQLLEFDTKSGIETKIKCRRIVNDGDSTKLVGITSNPKSPKTDIEDALNGKLFHEVLLTFKEQNEELAFLTEDVCEEIASYSSLNLRPREYEKMDKFFSKDNGRNKIVFANAYVDKMRQGDYWVPDWINEIKMFFA